MSLEAPRRFLLFLPWLINNQRRRISSSSAWIFRRGSAVFARATSLSWVGVDASADAKTSKKANGHGRACECTGRLRTFGSPWTSSAEELLWVSGMDSRLMASYRLREKHGPSAIRWVTKTAYAVGWGGHLNIRSIEDGHDIVHGQCCRRIRFIHLSICPSSTLMSRVLSCTAYTDTSPSRPPYPSQPDSHPSSASSESRA